MKNQSPTKLKLKHVGLDVHAETIAVAVAETDGEVRSYGNIPAHSHSVDRLHKKLAAGGYTVRYVYEAGPTGFWLARHFRKLEIDCQIVSPSLIPKKASDRVKTDRRDALALARLFRAGELTFVHVPDDNDEAVRDLVRIRLRAVEDLRRHRQRIKGFMLRYGRRYDGKSSWNPSHMNYLSNQKFPYPATQLAFEELIIAAQEGSARVDRLTQAIEDQIQTWNRLPLVKALMSLRGLALVHAVTWVAEIGNFSRFEHPSQLMSFIGLTPSEDSSGKRRQQGPITKAGNDACRRAAVEAAWQYRQPARVTPIIRLRHVGVSKSITDISWKAQTRLCERYRALLRKGKKPVVAIAAVARELVGFIWAVARVVEGNPAPVREVNPTPKKNRSTPGRGGKCPSAPTSKPRIYQLDLDRKMEPAKRSRSTSGR